MSDVPNLTVWRSLCEAFEDITKRLDRVKSVNVNARELRHAVRELSEHYLQGIRGMLINVGAADEEVNILDDAFGALLQLSHGSNAVNSYKRQNRAIKKTLPKLGKTLAINAGAVSNVSAGKIATPEEQKIAATLEALAPSAAFSYKQALADLTDETRVSFRGPALELREALREALEALAPDKDVMGTDGFKLEDDRKEPTTKQKVRFILQARGLSKSNREVPKDVASEIDELIGRLTRSVQNMSSIATHVSTARSNVLRVKRYIDAVLYDILEIK